jgi:uncharacterized membrane protein HdeD (DUF308 family)
MRNQTFSTTMTQVRFTREYSPAFSFSWAWLLVRGLVAIALGVVSILFPMSVLITFTMFFAAFALVDGLASLAIGIVGARRHERLALILRGLLGIIVGALFLLTPVVLTVSYAMVGVAIIVVWSILGGALELWVAIRLRKAMKGEWLLGLSGLLSILLGLAISFIAVINPVATILSVTWVIGIYALLAGAVLVVQAVRLRRGCPPSSTITPATSSVGNCVRQCGPRM